jgi:hypothetical protein
MAVGTSQNAEQSKIHVRIAGNNGQSRPWPSYDNRELGRRTNFGYDFVCDLGRGNEPVMDADSAIRARPSELAVGCTHPTGEDVIIAFERYAKLYDHRLLIGPR